jgi:soluble lytic murein transglycosylase-like protein
MRGRRADLPTRIQIVLAMTLTLCGARAYAAERVTLSNGFSMDCDHHAVVDGRMRLYLSTGERSYIDLKPAEVAAVEVTPDPPPPAHAQPQATTAALSTADLHEMLAEAGQAHNLDVDLLASVVKAESNGNAHAVSRAGAQGLMQLMPSTASGLGVKNSFEPQANVRGGTTYLDSLLTKYNENLAMALAAYNAGPGAVDRSHGIPPYHETRAYVARVIHEFNRRVQAHEREAKRALAQRVAATSPAPD